AGKSQIFCLAASLYPPSGCTSLVRAISHYAMDHRLSSGAGIANTLYRTVSDGPSRISHHNAEGRVTHAGQPKGRASSAFFRRRAGSQRGGSHQPGGRGASTSPGGVAAFEG